MKLSKADLILHPVRIRIIQTMAGGRRLTVQQMAELLPDVPQATMYRHLNKLTAAGLLSVVDQKQIRGTVERVYALAEQADNVTEEDLRQATREDHMRYFMTFLATMMGEYGTYLEQDRIDLARDGGGYRQAVLYLDDEEFSEFIQSLAALFQKAMANRPAPGRRRRTIATIIVPEANRKPDKG